MPRITPNRTVAINQLNNGECFFLTGNISYCRITSKIEGDELEKQNKNRASKGLGAILKPHTTITITNARSCAKNPNALTPAEIYAKESLYTTSNEPTIPKFTGYNKGMGLPIVLVRDPNNPSVAHDIIPKGELASGLKVTLMMRVFQASPNWGTSLDAVIVEEPIRYYQSNQLTNSLAEYGITARISPEGVAYSRGQAPTAEAPIESPAPVATAPTAAPIPETATPFAANIGVAMNAPVNPMGGTPVSNNEGIRYNPNAPGEQNRSY